MATVVPPELWSEIFGFSTTGTLARVSCVCRAFKALSQKHLYRSLYWDDSHYAQSRIWDEDPLICNYPQSLVLTDASSRDFHRKLMSSHRFAMDPEHSADIIRRTQLGIYRAVSDVIRRFANLVTLEFRNSTMPNPILSILHELTSLENLSIISGAFDTNSVPVTAPPRLRSLTLWRCRDSDQISWPRTFPQLLTNLLTPTLRTLRIDWTLAIAVLVTNQLPTPAPAIPLITTLCIRTPAGMSWVEGSPHFSLIAPLRAFLVSLTSLETFKVVGGLPDISTLPDNALQNLRTFSGPAGIALRMCARLHKVSLTDEWLGASVVANSLMAMENAGAKPRSLDLQLSAWDIEILYAVAALFKDMEELNVRYLARGSGPDEAQLVSIGPDILERMPKMRRLHVYQAMMDHDPSPTMQFHGNLFGHTDPVQSWQYEGRLRHPVQRPASYLQPSEAEVVARDEEVDEALRAWKRYGKALVEVKLDHAGIWRRANGQDEWAKRDHNPLDEEDTTNVV